MPGAPAELEVLVGLEVVSAELGAERLEVALPQHLSVVGVAASGGSAVEVLE